MDRIIIFSAFYDPFISGAERMVKEVVERLQDRYCFIIITARLSRKLESVEEVEPRRTLQERSDERRRFDLDNGRIKIVRIGLGYKWDKFLYPILAPFYALKYRPTIVHAVMESYAGIALSLYRFIALSLGRRPYTILTPQSGDLDLPEKQARIPKWLWRGIHCAPDLIVSIGNSMAERARRLGAKNVRVIPNGVDLEKVRETELRQEAKLHDEVEPRRTLQESASGGDERRRFDLEKITHRIICVARLSPEKGIEYLLDAMPTVLREFPSAKLVLVGNGALKEKLKAKSYKLQAQNSIEFLGNLSHEKTLEEIAKSEVLVLPSLAEGMGIVLVEAQALGVPVIGTNVGGIPDVIEHEKTGLLVPPRDSRAIAKAIILLLRDRELREGVARQAKTRLAKFDWQTIAEQYYQIYDLRFKNQEL